METKFNFKSQICTSREQSKRLIALGLRKETADMCYSFDSVITQPFIPSDIFKCVVYTDTENKNTIPAWSLHRLIEMMPENVTSDDWLGVSFDEISYYHGAGEGMIGWTYYRVGNLYDCIIECYEWLMKEGYFNKDYLCES